MKDTPWCDHEGKHGYYNSESNRAYWYCPTCGRIGRSPSKRHSIDRIDNDRGYEPGNICWAMSKWQVSNRRNTLRRNAYEFNGLLSFGT